MSEEKSKISLRSGKRKTARPKISAPQQISGPIPQDAPAALRPGAGRSIADQASIPRPRPPTAGGSKVSAQQSLHIFGRQPSRRFSGPNKDQFYTVVDFRSR